jgi:hypothetical protein
MSLVEVPTSSAVMYFPLDESTETAEKGLGFIFFGVAYDHGFAATEV